MKKWTTAYSLNHTPNTWIAEGRYIVKSSPISQYIKLIEPGAILYNLEMENYQKWVYKMCV